MNRMTIVGATGWGTTLAVVFARKTAPTQITLLTRTAEEAATLDGARQNERFAPGVPFPNSLKVAPVSEEGVLRDSDVIIIAVPSASMCENLRRIKGSINSEAVLISASKGMEPNTGRRMTQIIAEETGANWERIGALSGPNLAMEIAKGLPASATLGMSDNKEATRLQTVMTSDSFRIYASDDITGVELGGALKNIIAIGSGVIDEMGFGENAKAAFITRGLHEITRFGVAFGARRKHFTGWRVWGTW